MKKIFIFASITILLAEIPLLYFYPQLLWNLYIILPFILLGTYELIQTKRTIMRNYPLVGRFRYFMEELRPKIYQYFIESDTDGTPISRIFRSIVYQRAKKQLSTTPFGTQLDIYKPGYEWINHSMHPIDHHDISINDLRVKIGGSKCKKPYNLSILNISAMSFGALSHNAILALNKGAQLGGFAHNTGEGGVSPYHLKHAGDLIWQIGTGLFGCRNKDGDFDPEKFKQMAIHPNIKMIEIKISQGAKPGHGGILPAEKNTKEIARIRGVQPHTQIVSPASHNGFSSNEELLYFIEKLRDLSGGKPVGFKFCFGMPGEFDELCALMVKMNITPDYICIDGGEGGTGAAPLEFSNSIGMGLTDGLIKTNDILNSYDLRKSIKIIAAGKIISGFHIVKAIALGADACYSARAMMLALGCIQSLLCNKNTCPAGVATQDPYLVHGLHPDNKAIRIKNFHQETIMSVSEILAAKGLNKTEKLNRSHIWRRLDHSTIKNYEELYPTFTKSMARATEVAS